MNFFLVIFQCVSLVRIHSVDIQVFTIFVVSL